jgi:hypothetical protein
MTIELATAPNIRAPTTPRAIAILVLASSDSMGLTPSRPQKRGVGPYGLPGVRVASSEILPCANGLSDSAVDGGSG